MYDLNDLTTNIDKTTFFVLRVVSGEMQLQFTPFATKAAAEAEYARLNPRGTKGTPYGVKDAGEMRSTHLHYLHRKEAYQVEAKKAKRKGKEIPVTNYYTLVEADSVQWPVFSSNDLSW